MIDKQCDKEQVVRDATGLEKEISLLLDGHSVMVSCMAISLVTATILCHLDFDQMVEIAESLKESIDKAIEVLGRGLN